MTVKGWLESYSAEVVIRLIVVITLGISVVTFVKWQNLADCQAKYNQAYAQYAAAARDAKTEDDAVQQQLFSSIWMARKSASSAIAQKAVDAAFTKYFETIAENNSFRQAHPPPPLPDKYCG